MILPLNVDATSAYGCKARMSVQPDPHKSVIEVLSFGEELGTV